MTTHDTVVSGGLVVTSKGVAKLDIGVRREGGAAAVILHRHAVLRVELLEEPKEEPKLDPPPDAEPKADEG